MYSLSEGHNTRQVLQSCLNVVFRYMFRCASLTHYLLRVSLHTRTPSDYILVRTICDGGGRLFPTTGQTCTTSKLAAFGGGHGCGRGPDCARKPRSSTRLRLLARYACSVHFEVLHVEAKVSINREVAIDKREKNNWLS
jgi:hypothetical protein